jgi:hypothetical protein
MSTHIGRADTKDKGEKLGLVGLRTEHGVKWFQCSADAALREMLLERSAVISRVLSVEQRHVS